MQQTEIYKLNLIEKEDVFSPEALNENMEKVEEKLAALDGADEALVQRAAGLEGRVTALEVRKIAVGIYKGNGVGNQTILLGFTPKVAFIHRSVNDGITKTVMAVEGGPSDDTNAPYLTVVEGGITVEWQFNKSNINYYYFALA